MELPYTMLKMRLPRSSLPSPQPMPRHGAFAVFFWLTTPTLSPESGSKKSSWLLCEDRMVKMTHIYDVHEWTAWAPAISSSFNISPGHLPQPLYIYVYVVKKLEGKRVGDAQLTHENRIVSIILLQETTTSEFEARFEKMLTGIVIQIHQNPLESRPNLCKQQQDGLTNRSSTRGVYTMIPRRLNNFPAKP